MKHRDWLPGRRRTTGHRQAQPPSGEKIAAEIEREMGENLYQLRHVTLAPAEYHVYLHPDDFAYLEGIVPRIVEDVQACLNVLVQRLNRRTIWSRLTEGARPPIEVPPGGWAIHVKVSTNDDVNPGEIGIHSRLSVPASARFGTGAGTVRIAETVVAGGDRRTRMRTEAIPPDAQRPVVTPFPAVAVAVKTGGSAGTGPHTQAWPAGGVQASDVRHQQGTPDAADADSPTGRERQEIVHVVPPPLPRPVALSGPRLAYRDENGEHVHPITKDLTKIGRGGAEHWVDVMVTAGPQVSREHCRIRRDAIGRLFLQDVSTWGTYLNGTAIEKFGEGDAAAHEQELSHGASIRLADAVTIELLLR